MKKSDDLRQDCMGFEGVELLFYCSEADTQIVINCNVQL